MLSSTTPPLIQSSPPHRTGRQAGKKINKSAVTLLLPTLLYLLICFSAVPAHAGDQLGVGRVAELIGKLVLGNDNAEWQIADEMRMTYRNNIERDNTPISVRYSGDTLETFNIQKHFMEREASTYVNPEFKIQDQPQPSEQVLLQLKDIPNYANVKERVKMGQVLVANQVNTVQTRGTALQNRELKEMSQSFSHVASIIAARRKAWVLSLLQPKGRRPLYADFNAHILENDNAFKAALRADRDADVGPTGIDGSLVGSVDGFFSAGVQYIGNHYKFRRGLVADGARRAYSMVRSMFCTNQMLHEDLAHFHNEEYFGRGERTTTHLFPTPQRPPRAAFRYNGQVIEHTSWHTLTAEITGAEVIEDQITNVPRKRVVMTPAHEKAFLSHFLGGSSNDLRQAKRVDGADGKRPIRRSWIVDRLYLKASESLTAWAVEKNLVRRQDSSYADANFNVAIDVHAGVIVDANRGKMWFIVFLTAFTGTLDASLDSLRQTSAVANQLARGQELTGFQNIVDQPFNYEEHVKLVSFSGGHVTDDVLKFALFDVLEHEEAKVRISVFNQVYVLTQSTRGRSPTSFAVLNEPFVLLNQVQGIQENLRAMSVLLKCPLLSPHYTFSFVSSLYTATLLSRSNLVQSMLAYFSVGMDFNQQNFATALRGNMQARTMMDVMRHIVAISSSEGLNFAGHDRLKNSAQYFASAQFPTLFAVELLENLLGRENILHTYAAVANQYELDGEVDLGRQSLWATERDKSISRMLSNFERLIYQAGFVIAEYSTGRIPFQMIFHGFGLNRIGDRFLQVYANVGLDHELQNRGSQLMEVQSSDHPLHLQQRVDLLKQQRADAERHQKAIQQQERYKTRIEGILQQQDQKGLQIRKAHIKQKSKVTSESASLDYFLREYLKIKKDNASLSGEGRSRTASIVPALMKEGINLQTLTLNHIEWTRGEYAARLQAALQTKYPRAYNVIATYRENKFPRPV